MFQETEISKYRAETISVIFDFSDDIGAGASINGTPTVSVSVFSGIDSSPSGILYEGVSVSGGTVVEQRVRLGVIGTIYLITIRIQTTLGNYYEKECYLAILPENLGVSPVFSPLYETSTLYPYQTQENMQGNTVLVSGRLAQTSYSYEEGIQGSEALTGGIFTKVVTTYNNPPENIQGYSILTGGLLSYQTTITYTYEEGIQGAIALNGGTLANNLITYNNPHEDIQGGISLDGGTLA